MCIFMHAFSLFLRCPLIPNSHISHVDNKGTSFLQYQFIYCSMERTLVLAPPWSNRYRGEGCIHAARIITVGALTLSCHLRQNDESPISHEVAYDVLSQRSASAPRNRVLSMILGPRWWCSSTRVRTSGEMKLASNFNIRGGLSPSLTA